MSLFKHFWLEQYILYSFRYEFTVFDALKGLNILARGIALGILMGGKGKPCKGDISQQQVAIEGYNIFENPKIS